MFFILSSIPLCRSGSGLTSVVLANWELTVNNWVWGPNVLKTLLTGSGNKNIKWNFIFIQISPFTFRCHLVQNCRTFLWHEENAKIPQKTVHTNFISKEMNSLQTFYMSFAIRSLHKYGVYSCTASLWKTKSEGFKLQYCGIKCRLYIVSCQNYHLFRQK